MKKWDTVAIVGVGLIGGSIGMTLRKGRLAKQVIGVGRRAASLRKARNLGAVDSTTTNLERGVAKAELIVVCTPVGQIVEHVRRIAKACPASAIITDAGSTKAQIVAELDVEFGKRRSGSKTTRPRPVFIGSHPLAGSDKSGPEFAQADLFEGCVVVVTPTRRTCRSDLVRVTNFWKSLGAEIVKKTPRAHDESLAATSHVPHLVAAALAGATSQDELSLVAGGWLDTTRIAAGNANLWQQILLDNRDNVLKFLDKFEKELSSYRQALQHRNRTKIAKLLKSGKQNRDAVGG